MKLEGRVALVTGAGQGIGKEIALTYAREGAKIGVNDKTEEQALSSAEERRFGRIINVASQLGLKGAAELTHYCAAKAGIIGFTKALALEVAEHNITANSIAPGPIETDLVIGEVSPDQIAAQIAELPLGRYGQVEEVAPTAVLLAAEPDGNLYTGQTLGPNAGDVMP